MIFRVFLAIVMTAVILGQVASAQAQDARWEAAEAYDQATAAHSLGDYAKAARLFAVADELAPNAVALETALREAELADLPVLAMNIVQRARRQAAFSASLQEAIDEARRRFEQRIGFISVACDDCKASLDGEGIPVSTVAGQVLYASEPGERSVQLSTPTGPEVHTVRVVAGQTVIVKPNPPPDPSKIMLPIDMGPPRLHGIHPAWITIGIAATAALGGAGIASYVETLGIQSDLQAKRDQNDPNGAEELASSGRAAEIRTYVLEGLCAGSGIATVLVGVFAVDWNGPERDKPRKKAQPDVLLSPGAASLTWRF